MKRIYALWLLPEEKIYKKYLKVISDIASSHNTQKFRPHVTLIKNLEIEKKEVLSLTNKLVEKLKPIKTKFLEFGYSDRRHRSLYITVLETEELPRAHKKANQIFKHTEEPFLPHLSVVYGPLPIQIKKEISKSLKPLDKNLFSLDRLVLYDTTGNNENLWQEIKCYNL